MQNSLGDYLWQGITLQEYVVYIATTHFKRRFIIIVHVTETLFYKIWLK